jgi:aminoglycoside phosphotransferase (APT) family kinase protein
MPDGQDDPAARWTSDAFAARLATLAGAAHAKVLGAERLPGGAIQQNLRLGVAIEGGPWTQLRALVLRTDAPSAVAASRSRAQEFALLTRAYAAGVVVPQPIAFDAGDALFPPFMLMTFVEGVASGHRLTRAADSGKPALVAAIADNLARLHALAPPQPALAFLGAAPARPTRELIAGYRAGIAHWRTVTGDARPVLEWTLRWLEMREPAPVAPVLVHRDYRVGNLMVDGERLVATLDWEFAGWGDPREDLGWFCAPCWRFARPDLEAGGLGAIDDLLRGYNARAGTRWGRDDLLYWQVLAQLRWAVIALQQTLRFIDAGERSLELALTGRMLPELEAQMLALTGDRLA